MIPIDPQEKENMNLFEKGHRLNQVVVLPGYQDILDMFEQIADTYEARLINVPSGEPDLLIRDLLAEAKVARSILTLVQREINAAVEMGRQAALSAVQQQPTYSNF